MTRNTTTHRFETLRWLLVGLVVAVLAACGTTSGAGGPDGAADGAGDLGSDLVDAADAASGQDTAGDADAFDPGPGVLLAEATVGPEGGTVESWGETAGRYVRLTVPEGALAEATALRVLALQVDPADPRAVANAAYELEPSGLAFAVEASLEIGFSQADLRQEGTPAGAVHVHKLHPDGWRPVTSTTTFFESGGASARASLAGFSSYAVRIDAPVDPEAPVLERITWANQLAATAEGPVLAVPNTAQQVRLVGTGFGTEASSLVVTVGGAAQVVEYGVVQDNGFGLQSLQAPEPPELTTETRDYPVQVTVNGRTSNTLTLRVHGTTAVGTGVIEKAVPVVGVAGRLARFSGTFYGQIVFDFGGVEVAAQNQGLAQMATVRVPNLAPGVYEVRVSDGFDSPPSEPFLYEITDGAPPVLTRGPSDRGLWYLPSSLQADPPVPLHVGAAGWQSRAEVPYPTTFRLTTPNGTYSTDTVDCGAAPEGQCTVAFPWSAFSGMADGQTVSLVAETQEQWLDESGALEIVTRTSEPLPLLFHGAVPQGAEWPVSVPADGSPVTVPWQDFACPEAVTTMTAPGLWTGELRLAPDQHSRLCFLADQAGTYVLSAPAEGKVAELQVVKGGVPASTVTGAVPGQDLEIGFGGGRVVVPAEALPPLPDGGWYTLSARAWRLQETADAAPGDPEYGFDGLAFRVTFEPAVAALLAPVTVALPYDPSKGLGQFDVALLQDSGAWYSAPYQARPELGHVVLTLEPGEYGSAVRGTMPAPAATPGALPHAAIGDLMKKMGVVYQITSFGVVEDSTGLFRVEYVTDPASSSYASEAYADSVLDALMAVSTTLSNWDWPPPKTRVRIRSCVSWWTACSGDAKGATSTGIFGQGDIVVKSTMTDPAERATIVAHELGHVIERRYVGAGTLLSWWDEAAAEWVAWKSLSPYDLYSASALTFNEAAVRVIQGGLPDWLQGQYGSDILYGTAVFPLWMDHQYGPYSIRATFELLRDNPLYYAGFRQALSAATGADMLDFARELAKDFWLGREKPLNSVALGPNQDAVWPGWKVEVANDAGATIGMPQLGTLASNRLLFKIPTEAAQAFGPGDVLFRASGLGSLGVVDLFRQDKPLETVFEPVSVGVLEGTAPSLVLTPPYAGSWWAVVTNRSQVTSITPEVSVVLPRITHVSPDTAKAGELVSVSGHDFGLEQGRVRVGGKEVPQADTTWSDTYVTITMPSLSNTSAAEIVVVTVEGAKTNGEMIGVTP